MKAGESADEKSRALSCNAGRKESRVQCTKEVCTFPLALLMSDCLRSRRVSSQYRFLSMQTNKLLGVMWRVLHSPKAMQ